MTATFHKRDALPSALVAGGCALALLLAGAAVPAWSQTAAPMPDVAQKRSVPAAAAKELVVEQTQPAKASDPNGSDAVAPSFDSRPDTAIIPAQSLLQARRDRGVLFKVTPPPAVPLPAEVATQPAAAPPAAAAASPPPVRPSYLLGTIHFGSPEEQGIDYAVLEKVLGETDNFVNEVDVNSAWTPDFDAYRWLPVQTPLEGMIGKDDMRMAQALLPTVRPQDLQRMKPWAVLALLEARGESAGDTSMDARLQAMAAARGKHLIHLETLQQQLQALDCVPAGEHAPVLDERLRKSWILRIESAEAMAYYRSRNLDAWLASIDRMEGLSDSARAVEQRSRICLLEDRNARWIGPLETVLQDGPSLVAVGAIHLTGNDGLIARLRRDGYTVEAVPF
ncbi:MAG: TraB/GumN family protein [Xanthomonadaceae bacterium]|nr:TraB/GumN family protein [Xanthomonadaceae bacterium]